MTKEQAARALQFEAILNGLDEAGQGFFFERPAEVFSVSFDGESANFKLKGVAQAGTISERPDAFIIRYFGVSMRIAKRPAKTATADTPRQLRRVNL